ncbi:hypothetical protein KDK77_08945 [bacterium]|nr:hypothetical protein [bacterium]MCP5462636.1 hypothetical protein [bacterium]
MARQISENQRKYILLHKHKKTAEELAKHLNIDAKSIQEIIDSEQQVQSASRIESADFNVSFHPALKYSLLIIGFLLLFVFGYMYRMRPVFIQDSFMLDYDYGFHLRMTEEVLKHGRMPDIDPLAWYPEGKPVRELLPPILYYLGAGFYKIYEHFSTGSVQDSIVLFYALLCSLTMIPVFMIVKVLEKKQYIAFIGAALAALMPAHLSRTLCTRYRYEGPGVIFLLINMFFFIKAIEENDKKKFYIYSITATIFMMLAIGTWRVSLLFPTLYCVTLVLLIILRRTDARFLGAFTIQSAGVVLCFIGYTFLRSQNYIFTFNAQLIIGLGIAAACTKWWKKSGFTPIEPLLLLIPVCMLIFIPMLNLASGYESFVKILTLKIKYSIQKFKVTGIENILFMNTAELTSVPPMRLFEWDMCSWSAVLIFYYPITLFFFRNKKEKTPLGEILIAVFFVTLVFLTVLFYRNKVLLALFVGIAGAISVNNTIEFFKQFSYRKVACLATILFAGVIVLATGLNTHRYIMKLHVQMRSYLDITLKKFAELNSEKLPSLCYWSYGYAVQAYVGCPTFLDGLLESPRVHERLVEKSTLLLQNDEYEFYKFCRKYDMHYFVVDKFASRTQLYVLYAELPYLSLFDPEGKPTEKGKETIRARLCFYPQTLNKFQLLYTNPRFNIYKIL